MSKENLRFVKVVPEHVARNKVAQAAAFSLLLSKARTLSIRVFMASQGEVLQQEILAVSELVAIVAHALERNGDVSSPDYRVMMGALSALQQMSLSSYRWQTLQAEAVHQGLKRAIALSRSLSGKELRESWLRLRNAR